MHKRPHRCNHTRQLLREFGVEDLVILKARRPHAVEESPALIRG